MSSRVWRFPIFVSLAVALFFVGYPNFVILPTRSQQAAELQRALLVLRYQHLAELICAAVALIALTLYLMSKPEGKPRTRTIVAAAAVVLFAGLSHVDVYELLFHPAGAPAFQSARETKLDGDEHLLTVNLSGSRAYPIRNISYHHIVNDVVGGVPIAVTY